MQRPPQASILRRRDALSQQVERGVPERLHPLLHGGLPDRAFVDRVPGFEYQAPDFRREVEHFMDGDAALVAAMAMDAAHGPEKYCGLDISLRKTELLEAG